MKAHYFTVSLQTIDRGLQDKRIENFHHDWQQRYIIKHLSEDFPTSAQSSSDCDNMGIRWKTKIVKIKSYEGSCWKIKPRNPSRYSVIKASS